MTVLMSTRSILAMSKVVSTSCRHVRRVLQENLDFQIIPNIRKDVESFNFHFARCQAPSLKFSIRFSRGA